MNWGEVALLAGTVLEVGGVTRQGGLGQVWGAPGAGAASGEERDSCSAVSQEVEDFCPRVTRGP